MGKNADLQPLHRNISEMVGEMTYDLDMTASGKLHMGFLLVPISMSLNYPERPKCALGSLFALYVRSTRAWCLHV